MASDNAQAHDTDPALGESSPDCSRAERTRQPSGSAPRPWPSGAVLECADLDFEEDAPGDEGECTRITPGELIETLREASRSDKPPPALDASSAARPASAQLGDEDDTRRYLMQQVASGPRRSWIRRVVPTTRGAVLITGAAALTSLLALRGAPQQAPRRVDEKSELPSAAVKLEPVKPIIRVGPAQESAATPYVEQIAAATPFVEQLAVSTPLVQSVVSPPMLELSAPIYGQPLVANEAMAGSGAGGEPDSLALQRGWKRALDRAESRLAARDYDGAAFSFARAVELNPNDSRGYAGLGSAQLARGQWGEAVRALQRAIELAPNDAELHAELGRAYEQGGKPRSAARAFRRARKLDPNISE